MRPVRSDDLLAVLDVLVPLPSAERAAAAQDLIACANTAMEVVRVRKRQHPEWGNGSLMAAALARQGCRKRRRNWSFDDPAVCHATTVFLAALLKMQFPDVRAGRTHHPTRDGAV